MVPGPIGNFGHEVTIGALLRTAIVALQANVRVRSERLVGDHDLLSILWHAAHRQ
ncbi:hypothetical protein D3C81_1259120 [compost metagenome]